MTIIGEIYKTRNQSRVRMVTPEESLDETVVDLDLRSFFSDEENQVRSNKVAVMMGVK